MGICRYILLITLVLLGTACAPQQSAPEVAYNGFVRGKARVVDVDQELGKVVLDVSGRQITAYWEIETNLAQGGAIVANGPVRAPVANYHEPITHRELFPAAPGDVIAFVGYQTGKEILLRGVEVLPQ